MAMLRLQHRGERHLTFVKLNDSKLDTLSTCQASNVGRDVLINRACSVIGGDTIGYVSRVKAPRSARHCLLERVWQLVSPTCLRLPSDERIVPVSVTVLIGVDACSRVDSEKTEVLQFLVFVFVLGNVIH